MTHIMDVTSMKQSKSLLRRGLFILCIIHVAIGTHVEIFRGTVSPTDNKTYVQHLNGTTYNNYSTITWTYSFISRYYNNYLLNPIAYFRHVGQEHGYGTDERCFSRDFGANYAMDPRLVAFTPASRFPGRDKECYLLNSSYIACDGSIQVAIGLSRRFYVSVGFRCGLESDLDLEFNITVTAYNDSEIPCTDWSEALNKLEKPIPQGLQNFVNACSKMYGAFSRWNILGVSQFDLDLVYLVAVLKTQCYQLFNEFVCRVLMPTCQDNSVTVPCVEMCVDFNKGFSKIFDKFDLRCGIENSTSYNVSCTSLANERDPASKKCFYEQVQCSEHPILSQHTNILHQNGSNASAIANMSCDNFYKLSNNSFVAQCWYDGVWHFLNNASCDIVWLYVLGLAIGLTVGLAVILGIILYHFRFEFKLLMFKYCSCCVYCFFCLRKQSDTNKAFHAFIAYGRDERDTYEYVKKQIYEPLVGLGYNICVDFVHIQFSDSLVQKIPEAISKSSRIIIILNQEFLDSTWGAYELDQAIMSKLEDASLEFLIILKQDKNTLKKVPRWLKGYLRTHIYIKENDPFFISKLVQGLPAIHRDFQEMPEPHDPIADDQREEAALL